MIMKRIPWALFNSVALASLSFQFISRGVNSSHEASDSCQVLCLATIWDPFENNDSAPQDETTCTDVYITEEQLMS